MDQVLKKTSPITRYARFVPQGWIPLAIVWLVATAVNLDKAYHIDDTAYLEIAGWIVDNPAHPFSGMVNWYHSPEPIHHVNQPHFFFYLMAPWMKLFGPSEPAMHSLMALFSLLNIIAFYTLAGLFGVRRRTALTAAFVLSPLFLPSQNLMLDVPVTGLWLACVWALYRSRGEDRFLVLAMVFASCAVLTKYTSLPLLAAIGLWIALNRRWKSLVYLLIPVLAMAAWSLFTHAEYGGIHLLDRPRNPITLQRTVRNAAQWNLILGSGGIFAMAGLGLLTVKLKYRKPAETVMVLLVTVWIAWFFGGAWFGARDLTAANGMLENIFSIFGVILLLAAVGGALSALSKGVTGRDWDLLKRDSLALLVLLGGGAFIVLFAPFMAARHLLPVLPFVLLFFGRELLDRVSLRWAWYSVSLGIVTALLLGVSDWLYADSYRQQAQRWREELPRMNGEREVWHLGHWGWQWYASQAGFRQYHENGEQPVKGDYILIPARVHRQNGKALNLAEVRTVDTPGSFVTFFSTGPWPAFYSMSYGRTPWKLQRGPLASITLYKVLTYRVTSSEPRSR